MKNSAWTQVFLLAVVAFFSGAIVMVIELTGNRILAPVFGNSLYTWTGLIGVILTAMSAGYCCGGWLVDRKPTPVVLGHILGLAAVFVQIVPFLHLSADLFLSGTSAVWGPALAAGMFFALPGFLLGAVPPFCVRLVSLLSADRHVGISSGIVGTLSMLGSVAGTFATGFLLIPRLDLWTIFLGSGLVLACLAAAVYGIALRKPLNLVVSVVVLLFALLLAGWVARQNPPMPWHILFHKITFFHRIVVFRGPELANGDFVTTINTDNSTAGARFEHSPESPLVYNRYWELSRLYCPRMQRALFLGGGAFSMPQALSRAYPGARVEVCEIDPQVIEAGKNFFRTGDYPQMKIAAEDARRYLRSDSGQYDLVFGDVFHGKHNVPFHLVTKEFFALVRQRLSPDGIYMMNIISAIEGDKAQFFRAVARTLSEVFGRVDVYATNRQNPGHLQNIIIVAGMRTQNHDDFLQTELAAGLKALLATRVAPQEYRLEGSPVFTDSYNPVEYIVTANAGAV